MTKGRAVLLMACLAASAIGIVLAIHAGQHVSALEGEPDPAITAVHITRNPGLFVLPEIDKSITDRAVAGALAGDIEALPAFPDGAFLCPIDFGTTYDLTFSTVSRSSWSAVVSVKGCQGVTLSEGRVRRAFGAVKLFNDLGAALGLAPDELVPMPCPPPAPGAHCYAQPVP